MKKILALLAGLVLSSSAMANCYGTDTLKTCYDARSGNTYTIQKYGNQTYMQGSNPRTGSNWSQNSQTYGNTTYTQGRDAQGRAWSGTTTRQGNWMHSQGSNSRGEPYSGSYYSPQRED